MPLSPPKTRIFARHQCGGSLREQRSELFLDAKALVTPTMDAQQIAEAKRGHEVYMMLRHLDARRHQIEVDLLHVLAGEMLPQGKSLSHPDAADLAQKSTATLKKPWIV